MRRLLLAACLAVGAAAWPVYAQQAGFNLQNLQNMLNNPQTQQLLQQQLGVYGQGTAAVSATQPLSASQQTTLASQVQRVMQQNLTGSEQSSLQQFAATPDGQSIMGKLPGMMQQLAPVLLQMYLGQGAGMAPAAAPLSVPTR